MGTLRRYAAWRCESLSELEEIDMNSAFGRDLQNAVVVVAGEGDFVFDNGWRALGGGSIIEETRSARIGTSDNNFTRLDLDDVAQVISLSTSSSVNDGNAVAALSLDFTGAGSTPKALLLTSDEETGASTAQVALDGGAGKITLDASKVIQSAPATTPAAALGNGQISFYLDENGNSLKVAVKYSNGSTKTGTVALT